MSKGWYLDVLDSDRSSDQTKCELKKAKYQRLAKSVYQLHLLIIVEFLLQSLNCTFLVFHFLPHLLELHLKSPYELLLLELFLSQIPHLTETEPCHGSLIPLSKCSLTITHWYHRPVTGSLSHIRVF